MRAVIKSSETGQSVLGQVLAEQLIGLAHVGYIVEDLQSSIATFKRIYGIDDQDITVFPDFSQHDAATRFAFLDLKGTQVELIQALAEPFTSLLANANSGGGGINHLAWQVADIDACMAILATQGITPGYVTPDGIVDMGVKKMVYLDPHSIDGHYLELIEVTATQ
ncbi:hypothetical protein E2K93_09135 [Thalassotalea sp. HSM 43]|uniref:VOC family protein n=1 Tax=Thalassotalea sp. HSM 43 TaxID=2552945 RepID=UPI001081502A|nr:VOC family protein [Thalassotalea sp. HSM 43]QBY04543.1 hypothetical protein E2K93_09135 [Thalassotalea sp. HSM 43]